MAYTINGAKEVRRSHLAGSIEAGKLSDFAILGQSLLSLKEDGLDGPRDLKGMKLGWMV